MNKSMEDLLLEAVEDKYFQYKLNPLLIITVLKPTLPNFSYVNGSNNTLSVFELLDKQYINLTLRDFDHYREISKEYFERVEKLYKEGLIEQIEEEYDKEIARKVNVNKPNLSAQEVKGHLYTKRSKIPRFIA